MTNQEAYENMRVYLTRPDAQRAWCAGAFGCSYEVQLDDMSTHRCAVGCLLSPASIEFLRNGSALTGVSVHEIFIEDYYAPVVAELDGVDGDFLQNAQKCHDAKENWVSGVFNVKELDDLADSWGLRVVSDQPEAPVVAWTNDEALRRELKVVKDETPEGAPQRELVLA